MNPSATQQHHARRMKHWMLARAFPTTYLPTAPPSSSPSYYLPSSGGGTTSASSTSKRGTTSAAFPSKGATQHLITGGDSCSALATSPRLQFGVIRSVHRPYPHRPPRGEIRGILHSSSRQNSPWSIARLHLADSKRWGADYVESLSIRFSSTEYKPERFHPQASFIRHHPSRAYLPHTSVPAYADHERNLQSTRSQPAIQSGAPSRTISLFIHLVNYRSSKYTLFT